MTTRLAMPMLLCLLLPGCYTAPELSAHDSWATRVGHVFASDFSVSGWKARSDGLLRPIAAAPGELLRVQRLQPVPAAAADSAVGALERIPQRAKALALAEAQRPGKARSPDFARLSPDRIAHDFAAALASVEALLGLDRRPLGEIGDREHRTDPHDDRPEATLWQRVSRRLGL